MESLARRKPGRTDVEPAQLGFGAAGLGNLAGIVGDASAMLRMARDAGIRSYDDSPWYGRGQSERPG